MLPVDLDWSRNWENICEAWEQRGKRTFLSRNGQTSVLLCFCSILYIISLTYKSSECIS